MWRTGPKAGGLERGAGVGRHMIGRQDLGQVVQQAAEELVAPARRICLRLLQPRHGLRSMSRNFKLVDSESFMYNKSTYTRFFNGPQHI